MTIFEDTESLFDNKLIAIAQRVDEFESYRVPHGKRVAEIADAIGRELKMADHDRFIMRQAALVHDIGEAAMNRDYIAESRVLTDAERLDLQRHPVIGEQQAAKLGLPRGTQLLVRWHHEWWNGNGYPDALEGAQTPLAARILCIADAYASLISQRPFRRALSESDTRKILAELAGIQFDPVVVSALLQISSRPGHQDGGASE